MNKRKELEEAIEDYAAAKASGRLTLIGISVMRVKNLLDDVFSPVEESPQSTEKDSEHKPQLEGNKP